MRWPAVCSLVLWLLVPAIGTATEPYGLTTSLAMRDAMSTVSGSDVGHVPNDDWDWVDRGVEGPDDGRKSPYTAVFRSAILPGMGERYVGNTRRSNIFLTVEAAIWAAIIFYRVQGDQRADRYREFANLNAAAPLHGDSDYYEHIGFWLSLEEWHDIVHRDARLRFPDDPAARQDFFETNKRYDRSDSWRWPDDEVRTRYRQLRSRSERSYRNSRMGVGALVVNRLASMIDALALARRHNHALEEEKRAHIELRVAPRKTVDGLVVGPMLSARY